MVNTYKTLLLSWHLICCTLLLLTPSVFANSLADLRISVSSQNIELGKPIKLTFESPQTKISLNELELNALVENFYIRESSELQLINNHQYRTVHLYPRKPGTLSIPGLFFLNTSTKAIPVNVIPATDIKTNTPLKLQTTVSSSTPWKKQQVIVKFEFLTKIPIITFNVPSAYSEHSDIYTLDVTSEPVDMQQEKWTRHTVGWAIYPKQAGNHQLNLPAVQLVRDGVTTHHFYPPLINLEVKQLPIYIPSTMNIGKLDVVIVDKPTSPLLLGNLGKLKLKLVGHGSEPGSLPGLTAKLKSSNEMTIYPPGITSQYHSDQYGIHSEALYDITFKAKQQGLLQLQTIDLSYYDPVSGTIKSISKETGRIFSLHSWLAILSSIIVFFIGFISIKRIWTGFKSARHTYRSYYHALKQIGVANTPRTIKSCLDLIAKAENWPDNMTMRQWHSLSGTLQGNISFEQIKQLEQAIYHEDSDGDKADIEAIKNSLVKLCYLRQPLLRWLT